MLVFFRSRTKRDLKKSLIAYWVAILDIRAFSEWDRWKCNATKNESFFWVVKAFGSGSDENGKDPSKTLHFWKLPISFVQLSKRLYIYTDQRISRLSNIQPNIYLGKNARCVSFETILKDFLLFQYSTEQFKKTILKVI